MTAPTPENPGLPESRCGFANDPTHKPHPMTVTGEWPSGVPNRWCVGGSGATQPAPTPDAADEREAGITPGGNPTCPKCGRWYGPGEAHVCDPEHNHWPDEPCPVACPARRGIAADEREALVEVAAEALHERFAPDYVGHWSDLDEFERGQSDYPDMARAVLDAVADRLVAPLKARLAEVEADFDKAVKRAIEGQNRAINAERRAERAEADLAAAEQRALYAARDALYRGEGPDMFQDADIVYGEWLGNRADRLAKWHEEREEQGR